MTEPTREINLADLFEEATRAVAAHQREINELDGYNGNHGDNIVTNANAITSELRKHRKDPPAEALKAAGQKIAREGAGGSSRYYAQGLQQAAEQLAGKEKLNAADGMTLIQTLLGALPREGYPEPEQTQSTSTVLDMLTAMAGGGQQTTQPAQPVPQASSGGSLLDTLVGLAGGQQTQPTQTAPQQADSQLAGILGMLTGGNAPQQGATQTAQPAQTADDNGLDLGDVVETLLPAGLAYLQARQGGADTAQAGQAALLQALMGGQQPQPSTSREAAGIVLAQSMLKALLGNRS